MAAAESSIHEVAERTGLDTRTIRGITRGTHRPHARTLHRLAEGLRVAVDEFFVDPAQLLYRCFDRRTNPAVDEVCKTTRNCSRAGARPISTNCTAAWGPADN